MICPHCGAEMQKGAFHTSAHGRTWFAPDQPVKPSWEESAEAFFDGRSRQNVDLLRNGEAWYCKPCGRVIAEIPIDTYWAEVRGERPDK